MREEYDVSQMQRVRSKYHVIMAQRQSTTLQGPPAQMRSQLEAVAATDQVVGGRRSLCAALSWILGALAALCFFTGLWPLGIPFALGAVVAAIFWSNYRGADLDNKRLELAATLLTKLREDLPEKAAGSITIRHGDCFTFGALKDSAQAGMSSGARSESREDKWFAWKSRLSDGSACGLAITASGKRKSKSKRKYTKINERLRDKITLSLRLPAQRYPHLELLEQNLQRAALQTRAGLTISGVQTRGSQVRVIAQSGEYGRLLGRGGATPFGEENRTDAAKLLELLASVYGGLSHCGNDDAPKLQSKI